VTVTIQRVLIIFYLEEMSMPSISRGTPVIKLKFTTKLLMEIKINDINVLPTMKCLFTNKYTHANFHALFIRTKKLI